jgi:CRP-like cAMP-binding protein
LLASLKPHDRSLLEPFVEAVDLRRGEVLFEPGEDIVSTHFPGPGSMISLVLSMRDGRTIEAATIGREGFVGGLVSAGVKPSFARIIVQIGGVALRLKTARLEEAKKRSASLRDLFSRYADALLSQVLQSVACNALHTIEERCSRWLLIAGDRVTNDHIPLTQEFLAEMLGVQRTTVSTAAQRLQRKGLIRYSRGLITISDRRGLEEAACECYATVAKHVRSVFAENKPLKIQNGRGESRDRKEY